MRNSMDNEKIYEIEIHVMERPDSTSDNSLFDCWVAGDGADRLDYFAELTYPTGICNLQIPLEWSKAIRYGKEIEKLADEWSCKSSKQVKMQVAWLVLSGDERLREMIYDAR
jgi:hypothetical protein